MPTRIDHHMHRVRVPWGAWYGDGERLLSFPDDWQVQVAEPAEELAPLGDEAIRLSFSRPIGTDPIRRLAEGKKRAAIVIDDLTRPTPVGRLLPFLLDELRRGGIDVESVHVIVGMGCHRPLTRPDLIRKMGKCLYNVLAIYNHHPYENLSHLGKSSRGTEVYINNMYLQSDIRIGIGTIMPHVMAGFGGGAKIVAIGVAGMETISQNHDGKGLGGQGGPVGNVDHNPMRADLEEIARMAELDAIVNVVANRRRQIGGVFVGELVEAHRRGVAMHRKVWSTRCPRLMDVAVFNVYPKDVNPGVINALSPSWIEGEPVVRRGGVVVFTTASPEGPDIHSRESFGMRGHEDLCDLVNTIELFKERQVIVYSPNLARRHIRHQLPEGSLVCQRWSEVINSIKRTVAGRPRVAVFPTASFQLGY